MNKPCFFSGYQEANSSPEEASMMILSFGAILGHGGDYRQARDVLYEERAVAALAAEAGVDREPAPADDAPALFIVSMFARRRSIA